MLVDLTPKPFTDKQSPYYGTLDDRDRSLGNKRPGFCYHIYQVLDAPNSEFI